MRKFITKKRIIILSIFALMVVTVLVLIRMTGNKTEDAETTVKASEGQSITYAKITAINGNEMDVAIQNVKKNSSKAGNATGKADNANPPEGMSEMPDMSSGEIMSEMPSGGSMPNMSGESGMTGSTGTGSSPKKTTRTNAESYEDTGDTAFYQIPVGTDVITKLGAVTTFTHLDAGDVIAILTSAENDTILKIWIVQ